MSNPSFHILLLGCLCLMHPLTAQHSPAVQDSLPASIPDTQAIPLPPPHSAHRATIYSMVLPGLGQTYNKKYWKIPVIYGGFAAVGYFIGMNTKEYRKFRDAYNYVSNGDSTETDNDYVVKYSLGSLQQGRDYYRRNMELSYIIGAAIYILNIIDAAVDAHLWDFDVSEDLSLRIQPTVLPPGREGWIGGGLSLSFQIK